VAYAGQLQKFNDHGTRLDQNHHRVERFAQLNLPAVKGERPKSVCPWRPWAPVVLELVGHAAAEAG